MDLVRITREVPHEHDISTGARSMDLDSTSSGYQSFVYAAETLTDIITAGSKGQANITLQKSISMPSLTPPFEDSIKYKRSLSLGSDVISNGDGVKADLITADIKGREIIPLQKGMSMPSLARPLEAHVKCACSLSLGNDIICSSDDTNAVLTKAELLQEKQELYHSHLSSSTLSKSLHSLGFCEVCFDSGIMLVLACCQLQMCLDCMCEMIDAKLSDGVTSIPCPSSSCTSNIEDEQIQYFLKHDKDLLERYTRFKVAQSNSRTEKLCPFCSHVTVHHLPKGKLLRKVQERDVKVKCDSCMQDWCFACHAPWHAGVSCTDMQGGNKLFKKWLRGRNLQGQANAQRCPNCKVPIQRTTGCDSMRCSRCNTRFCYRCGGYFKSSKVFGKHYSYLSVNGCKGGYKGSAAERETVRYGYLFAKSTYLAAYPVVFIGVVGVVAVGGLAYLTYKGGQKVKRKIKSSR